MRAVVNYLGSGRFDLREAEKVEPYAKGSKKDPLRYASLGTCL